MRIMSTEDQGYADGMSRPQLPHPTDKIMPGVVVRHMKTGRQHKVLEVDPATRLFSRHGGPRTEWHAYDDFTVLEGQLEALDVDDPEAVLADRRRALEEAEAQVARVKAERDALVGSYADHPKKKPPEPTAPPKKPEGHGKPEDGKRPKDT